MQRQLCVCVCNLPSQALYNMLHAQPGGCGWIWEYLNGAGIEMYEVQLPNEVGCA